jgi:hypothetical protein
LDSLRNEDALQITQKLITSKARITDNDHHSTASSVLQLAFQKENPFVFWNTSQRLVATNYYNIGESKKIEVLRTPKEAGS